MKTDKALLYGLTAGLVVLLYFKFGTPKAKKEIASAPADNPDMSKEIPRNTIGKNPNTTLVREVDRRIGTTDDPKNWDQPVRTALL